MANTQLYGFIGLEHLYSQRVDDDNIMTVNEAIDASLAEYTRQFDAMSAELLEPTTEYQVRFKQAGAGTLQPLDEWGNPLPTRPAGYYDVAFPIQGGGDAFGTNRVTRALITVEEVRDIVSGIMQKDKDWVRRHVLAALLDDTTWTFPDEDHGDLTIQPLANGDSVTYAKQGTTSGTDTHYLAQAAAVADATNPFDTIYEELNEHPGNEGPFVAYIPTNIKADVEALTAFRPVGDPNIAEGISSDRLVTSIDRGFGDRVIGYVNSMWIVEWGALPDDYILAVARGASAPPLRMRQYPAASLQGLFRENHSPDGNLQENRFIRYAGFGAYNRVAALAYFVEAGDTTYDAPFTNPLAV